MIVNDICPFCVKITSLEKIKTKEDVKVRGETITVQSEFFRCLQCAQEFEDPKSEIDPLALAYQEYRRLHGMLQPEDIRELRKQYDLTQKELSELLSWGEVTLSRYEKGKLQDNAHDTMLQLILNPINMLNLVRKNEAIFSLEKKNKLIKKLTEMIQNEEGFESIYQLIFGSYEPNIFSGNMKLEIKKVHNMMSFFCYPEGQFQTKLCKLIFYADNLHFKKYNQSITGLQYIKMPFGPVPNHYERYKIFLVENNFLQVEEIPFNDEIFGEKLTAFNGPNLSLFSKDEIETLTKVRDFFNKFSSKKISEHSHQEEGYVKTSNRSLISFEYAKNLKIS